MYFLECVIGKMGALALGFWTVTLDSKAFKTLAGEGVVVVLEDGPGFTVVAASFRVWKFESE